VAAIIAVAANTGGRREIIGLGVGPSEAETFWMVFLRSLKARGIDGVKLVVSDAHNRVFAGRAAALVAAFRRGVPEAGQLRHAHPPFLLAPTRLEPNRTGSRQIQTGSKVSG